VGFSPEHPEEQSILNGAETQAFLNHFTAKSKEKTGKGMGLEWMLSGVRDPIKSARDAVKAGTPADVVVSAIHEFDSLTSARYSASQHAEAQRFKSSYETVANNFGRDVDAAVRAGALPGVPTMQVDQLRELFKKRDDDPSYDVGRSQFGDVLTAGPGWSDNWKSEADLMATWLPRVGPKRFEEIRHQWEADQRRPKALDGAMGREFGLLDNRLRVALDWQENGDPARRSWSGNGIESWQMDLHEWAVHQFNTAVEQYHEQVKAGKSPDPKYFETARNDIMKSILNGKKQADKKTKVPVDLYTAKDHPGIPPSVQGYLNSAPGSVKITDGKQVGWLSPHTPMPAGWQEAP
jgi:hypothetical protein